MELYTTVSYELSRRLTVRYSSSFSLSSRLFHRSIRGDIYAIYGLVRIADEIVDTYRSKNAGKLLIDLEQEVEQALQSGFSTNMVVHAFAQTAREYGIEQSLVSAFFTSMRMDLSRRTYTVRQYHTYIYGSAEVIGLMCLRVFCGGDDAQYQSLKEGAAHLGSAYQKINFLRDLKADYQELGRMYFPDTSFEDFDNQAKAAIIADIKIDLEIAQRALKNLPSNAKRAVAASFSLYSGLLRKLEAADSEAIKSRRIRVPAHQKIYLLLKGILTT